MKIREAEDADLGAVMGLYAQLHEEPEPPPSEALSELWCRILADPNRHIVLVEMDRVVTSTCEVLIVPNLTRGQRPYALVENLVTDQVYRCRGCAAAALQYAVDLARAEGCYKVMLMSSRKDEATKRFYEKCGFDSQDKTAYVYRLN